MPDVALLIDLNLTVADHTATNEWKWQPVTSFHREYERPDTRERIRTVPDGFEFRGLRWGTRVYLGAKWQQRADVEHVRHLIDSGFFQPGDPELPPPRPRRKRATRAEISELKSMLQRLEDGR